MDPYKFIYVNGKRRLGSVETHFIYFIDSRLGGLNVAKYMMNNYANVYSEDSGEYRDITLLPGEILETAALYWKKYFEKEYEVDSLGALKRIMEIHNVDDDAWKHLIKLYDNTTDYNTRVTEPL